VTKADLNSVAAKADAQDRGEAIGSNAYRTATRVALTPRSIGFFLPKIGSLIPLHQQKNETCRSGTTKFSVCIVYSGK
jgi:hypothetical protein